MKRITALSFCVLLFVAPFTGCAGSKSQIKEPPASVEAAESAAAVKTAEAPATVVPAVPEKSAAAGEVASAVKTAEAPATVVPAVPEKGVAAGAAAPVAKKPEAAYSDKKENFEVRSTPFGYIKQSRKPADVKSGAPAPGKKEIADTAPAVAVDPSGAAPAAATPAGGGVPDCPIPAGGGAPVCALPALPGSLGPNVPNLVEEHIPSGQVSFDFDDADLYAVIRVMADFLKINYIIEPSVSGKVTVHTAGNLKAADVFPIFYQTLEVNGLTAVKEGNVYRILRTKDAVRMPIVARLSRDTKDVPPEERIILQIIPLKFISAQEMTKVMTPFISSDGTIISEAGSNTLLVVDKGINIIKCLKLVEVFDVSVFDKISHRFYNLENTSAEEMVKTIREVLSVSVGGVKDDVKFIPINRLNALLIVSLSPDIFDRVDGLIRKLDVPSEGAQPQIHVYSVKNGMATDLAEILTAIFNKGGEVKKSVTRESVPTNPFVKGTADKKTTAGPSAVSAPSVTSSTGSSATLRGEIRITADPIRNALIIEATPGDYKIVEGILGRLDILPRQVLIEVVIAEISLGQGTDLGIEWTFKKDNWTETGSLAATVGASGVNYALGLSQKWLAALHAMASESKLNVLSSPSVLASDNKQAKIDVTTEVPIPSTSYTIVTSGTTPVMETKIQYRNTGVILEVTPHINEYGLVTMDISQEVSGVGELLKVAGQEYYSFNNRKILTSLTVKHNQSVVIGGLINNKKNDASSGVPWLVKVPFLRWLFGTEKKDETKSELIVMITPHVITSLDDVDAVSEEFRIKIGNAQKAFK